MYTDGLLGDMAEYCLAWLCAAFMHSKLDKKVVPKKGGNGNELFSSLFLMYMVIAAGLCASKTSFLSYNHSR